MEILVPLVVFVIWWFCYTVFFQNHFRDSLSLLELLSVSISFTIVLQTFVFFVVSFFIPKTYTIHFILLLPLMFAALGFRCGFDFRNVQFGRIEAIFTTLLGVYFVIVSIYVNASFKPSDNGIRLGNLFATEVLWHASVVSQLDHASLPSTLQFYPSSFTTYHFFPDLFIYILSRAVVFNQPLVVFVYVFLPIVLTAFALNTYALATRLWNGKVGLVAVFIMLFCYDSTALILWGKGLIREGTPFFGSFLPEIFSFWTPILNQFQMFHNPSILLSSALILNAFFLTHFYDETKKTSWLILSALAWIFLAKVKITTFLMGMSGLIIVSILQVWFKKEWYGIKLVGVIVILGFPVLWLCFVGSGNANEAVFSNFFFINNFAVRTGIISRTASDTIREYGYPGDWWSGIKFVLAFFFYYAGILGFRLVALCYDGIFNRTFGIFKSINFHGILIFSILSGIFTFTVFGAKLAKYDTMWFFIVAMVILNLYVAERLVHFAAIKKLLPLKIFVGTVMFFSLLSFVIPAMRGVQYRKMWLSASQLDAFEVMRRRPEKGRILARHYDLIKEGDEDNFLLTAFTAKSVVSEGIDYSAEWLTEDPVFIEKTNKLRIEIDTLFKTRDSEKAKEWLDKLEVSLVYLQSDTLHFDVKGILNKIYDKDNIQVYARINL